MDCWLCGDPANSREHKFKSSDLRRHYRRNGSLVYISDEVSHSAKNDKDDVLKFEPVLCNRCNNGRTQAHDDAYDLYAKYIESNYMRVRDQAAIDLSEVFGDDRRIQRSHLMRYFAKHAGCKVMTGEYPYIPQDLIDFVNGSNVVGSLMIHFETKEGVYVLENELQKIGPYRHLFNGPTLYFSTGREKSGMKSHAGWLSYSWMSVNWVVSSGLPVGRRLGEAIAVHPVEITTMQGCAEFTPEMGIAAAVENIEYGSYRTIAARMARFASLIDP